MTIDKYFNAEAQQIADYTDRMRDFALFYTRNYPNTDMTPEEYIEETMERFMDPRDGQFQAWFSATLLQSRMLVDDAPEGFTFMRKLTALCRGIGVSLSPGGLLPILSVDGREPTQRVH